MDCASARAKSFVLAELIYGFRGTPYVTPDPACGSGSLLIRVAKEVKDENGKPSKNFSLFGQESNGSTWALSRMNMFLHEQDADRVEWCDTITNPKLVEDDKLMKFNEDNVYLHNQRLGLVQIQQSEVTSRDYLLYLFNATYVRKDISEAAGGTKIRHTSPDKICSVVALFSPETSTGQN